MTPLNLIGYVLARSRGDTSGRPLLPPIAAAMYEYVLAANGLFIRARRRGLEAMLPVAPCAVRGLAAVEPYVHLDYPRVPADIVRAMLACAQAAREETGAPVEIIFHLTWEDEWRLHLPPQEQGRWQAQPTGPAIGSTYERALIEVHSHHTLRPAFSMTDDADETGFRIYGVLGEIFTHPALRMRAGIYGYRWEVPADWVFSLPEEVADAIAS